MHSDHIFDRPDGVCVRVRLRSQLPVIAILSSGGMYGMVPLPTHITIRKYAGPFDVFRSQISEVL